ncbi:MAG: tetratricopeptide repeat protein [Nitrospirae bacterium]|nr:tetratricopeptide repeat protein [Nitrospirota bacterium]
MAILVALTGFLRPTLSLAQESAADVVTAEASLAYDDGNLEEALVLLNQALELYPDHTEALYYLGLIYLKQDKLDESLSALQKAYELEPKSPSVAFQLGVVHFSRE